MNLILPYSGKTLPARSATPESVIVYVVLLESELLGVIVATVVPELVIANPLEIVGLNKTSPLSTLTASLKVTTICVVGLIFNALSEGV